MIVYIYHLLDPEGRVRYVGKAVNPKRRFAQHLARRSKTHCSNWIKSLLTAGKRPSMAIVRECCETDWEQGEREEIAKQRAAGANLCNITEGGETGAGAYTPEIRAKLSKAGRRRWSNRKYRRDLLARMNAGRQRARRNPSGLPTKKKSERAERISQKRRELYRKYFCRMPTNEYEIEKNYVPYLTAAFIEKYYDQLN